MPHTEHHPRWPIKGEEDEPSADGGQRGPISNGAGPACRNSDGGNPSPATAGTSMKAEGAAAERQNSEWRNPSSAPPDTGMKVKGAAAERIDEKVKDKYHRHRGEDDGTNITSPSATVTGAKEREGCPKGGEGTHPSPSTDEKTKVQSGEQERREWEKRERAERLPAEARVRRDESRSHVIDVDDINNHDYAEDGRGAGGQGGDFHSSPKQTDGTPRRSKCRKRSCPNHGGRCGEHGKMSFPCKANDCRKYTPNQGGLCKEHTYFAYRHRAASGGDHISRDGHSKDHVLVNGEDRSPVAGKKPPPDGFKNEDILLSMTFPRYKSIISGVFEGMEINDTTSVPEDAGLRVWAMLKRRGNFWVIPVGGNMEDLQQIDEKKALQRIKADISRHLYDEKRRGKKRGNDVDRCTGGDGGKKRSANEDGGGDISVPPSKKQKECHAGRKTRNSMGATFQTPVTCGATVHENPKLYVGMHIFGLLKEEDDWKRDEKKAGDGTNYIDIIYCPDCDKKNAVEGEDKFTGYPALAQWAYETGYYKDNVVDTENGREIMELVGILDDPYSIFEKKVGDPARGETYRTASVPCHNDDEMTTSRAGGNPVPRETSEPVHNDVYWPNVGIVDNQAAGEETEKKVGDPVQGKTHETASVSFQSDDERPTSRVGGNPALAETLLPQMPNDDHRLNIDMADNQAAEGVLRSASGPVHINDDDVLDSSQQTKSLYQKWFEAFSGFDEKLATATDGEDITGMAFYSHLVHYMEAKASRGDFCLESDKDIIAESITSFEDWNAKLAKAIKENRQTQNGYKLFLKSFINSLKEQLPLS
jgi:hypothetical protein